MNEQPDRPPAVIVLHLHPKPGNWRVPWHVRLRAALKRLGRDYGLRCTVCRPVGPAGEPEREPEVRR
jgi:hypothetical protein